MSGYVSIPRKAPSVVKTEPKAPEFGDSTRKADLVAEAEKRGLDTSGTKADLLARLG